MKFSFSLILIAIISLSVFAISEDAGTSGFSFLKVNYSARAAAMASAFTGLSNDASAVFFNPAGLSQIQSKEISTTYMSYFDGIQCGSVVYAFPYDDKTTLAAFSQFLTATEDRTLADANGNYAGTDGTFGISEVLLGVSASRRVLAVLDLGINIKYLQESLDEYGGSAVAVDIALLHQTTNKNLKVGIALKNLGKQLSYYTGNEYEEKLPQLFVAGFSYHPDEKFFATLDIYKPMEFDFSGRLGVEYQIHDMLALRCGYKSNAKDWRAGGDHETFAGLSFGFGINWQKYTIDYAVISYGDLGYVNQVSLKYSF